MHGLRSTAATAPGGRGGIARRVLFGAVLAVMATMSAGMPSALIAAPARAAHQVQYLALQDPYMGAPAVYGNTVAWSGTAGDLNHPRPSRLYIAQVGHFHPHVVAVSTAQDSMIQTHLSARWIAWEDQGQGGSWAIWAVHRRNGHRLLVDSSKWSGPAPHPWMYPLLSLSGDMLAWSRVHCAKTCIQGIGRESWTSSIQLRYLSTGASRTIGQSTAPCLQYWPSLAPNVLVWHEEGVCAGVAGSDVLLFDRSTHKIRHLTADHRASEPTTNGQYVAWKDAPGRFDGGTIILLNLRTGQRAVASGKPSKKTGCQSQTTGRQWITCDVTPTMTSTALVWLAGNGATVMAYDLSTGRRRILQTTVPGKVIPGLLGASAPGTRAAVWEAGGLSPTQRSLHKRSYIAIVQAP